MDKEWITSKALLMVTCKTTGYNLLKGVSKGGVRHQSGLGDNTPLEMLDLRGLI